MNTQQNQTPQDTEKLKEIPKWTRKYAQNRTLTNLAFMAINLLFIVAIGGLSLLAGIASKTGHPILSCVCTVVLIAVLILLFIVGIPKFGGVKIWRWIDRRIYGQEGIASIPEPELMKKKKWLGYVVAIIFGSCVMGSVFLGGKYNLPIKYMQPISAIYLVPFMTFLYFWQRPKVSPILLLWPILYAIHAILIVAGVPILFTGNFTGLNMFLPTFGYGVLTFTIGHIYSRYALKKLKGIARLEGEAANGA
ncbi:MAG: hypothetical protein WC770_01675 [Phycisphaerae bacterium]|jgi:hypothetical protein